MKRPLECEDMTPIYISSAPLPHPGPLHYFIWHGMVIVHHIYLI